MKAELSQIEGILHTVFETTSPISANTTQADIAEWDSIGHLNLILELEDKFKVSLTTEDILAIKSVNDIIIVLSKY